MPTDISTRLRLVEITTPGGVLRIGGRFACVLATPSTCNEAAAYVAATVAGPRPPGSDALIDIAGRFVSVGSLPAPLLAPSAPSVIGPDLVRSTWKSVRDRRRDSLAAEHAALRLARHRTEAALERARTRVAAALPTPAPAIDEGDRARIRALHEALERLQPIPVPEALVLAAQWEEHRASRQAPTDLDGFDEGEVDAARTRVRDARAAVAHAAGTPAHADVRTQLEALHREVGEAEMALGAARRRERPAAAARYEAAVRAEHEALAAAGIASYASLLVDLAQGVTTPCDPDASERAAQELAAAEAALAAVHDKSRRRPAAASGAAEREIELRARAAELLGRFPGDDVATELRALRVAHPDAARLRGELDALAARSRGAAAPAPEPVALGPDVEDLERAGAAQTAALESIDAELVRLELLGDSDLAALSAADLVVAVEALLDTYRAGELLAGRLPMVFAGALDALSSECCAAIGELLGRARDVQPIVVCASSVVAEAVRRAGGVVVDWPHEAGRVAPTIAPVPPGRCKVHPGEDSISGCARCGRSSCIDCLVYVIGEPHLWCASCARSGAAEPRSRLLRRRGA